jgi:Mg/Co/Ni transporter MgtE
MQVRKVMSKEVISVRRSMKLRELLGIFKDFHIFPLVPVVEDDNRLIGVVSFRNILDVFQSSHPDVLKLVPFLDEEEQNIFRMDISEDIGDLVVVQDIMDLEYIYIREDTSLEEVYKLMDVHLKEELPVVDRSGRLVGRVGIFDIIKFLFKQKGIMS